MNPPLPAGITAKPPNRKATDMMKILSTLALGGAAAAAIALAPAAGATSTVECDSTGPASVCSKPGHASITASPGDTRANPAFGFWPFGAGPTPPVFAMD